MKVRTMLHSKVNNIRKLSTTGRTYWYNVGQTVKLSPQQFEYFASNMLDDYDFINNLEIGANAVAIVTDGANSLVVDNQGYSYARYVGHVLEIIV